MSAVQLVPLVFVISRLSVTVTLFLDQSSFVSDGFGPVPKVVIVQFTVYTPEICSVLVSGV